MAVSGLYGDSPAPTAAAKVDFVRDVKTIFESQCYECHGEKKQKGHLRLDSKPLAMQGGKTGAAILPGQAAKSYLVQRIRGQGNEDRMPLDKPALSEAQVRTIEAWIDQGANWPDTASVASAKIETHWSFEKPVRPPLPSVHNSTWPRNPIDHFILARLEKEGIQPSPEADRPTLIRRLSLDLIGLPPTPEEVEAFVNDASPDAYEKLVDRLLASPHYGERWARRWLDLARYSDTNGYEKDRPRSMYPYRDWVINALNNDMPFDQFTVEQIAGDMLPNATTEQKVATGFHRNTMLNEEGGIDPLEYRYYAMVDRVATTGMTWLGLTVQCAQCHNHKYDPISQKEYYQFMALLNNADEPVMDVPSAETESKKAQVEKQIAALTADLPKKFAVHDEIRWQPTPETAKLTTTADESAQRQPDNSWKVLSPGPDKDTYTFTFETPADSKPKPIDRLRLETLIDSPTKGPGRTPQGNFVLSEITLTVTPKDSPDKPQTVKFSKAEADFSQPNFPVTNAIDGKTETGWAIAEQPTNAAGKPRPKAKAQAHKNRTATFYFDKPLALAGPSTWTVRLDQQHGQRHTIGHFRLSLGAIIVTDTRPMEIRRSEALAKAFSTWQDQQATKSVPWTVLKPADLKSNACTLTALDDNSVLVSGDVVKSTTYDMTLPHAPAGVTAVMLEVLPHPSLPANGPGKVFYEGQPGDFFLSTIALSEAGKPAKFTTAVQDFAAGKNVAANSIDADPQSGWAIAGGQGKPHYAIFTLEKPTAAKDLSLHMLFERYYASPLGRFRIWVTTDPNAAHAAPLPPDVQLALATPESNRTATQKDSIFQHFLSVAPELADARAEIEKLRESIPKPPTTLVMQERPAGHTRPTYIHHRGEFLQTNEEVQPAVPSVLPPLPKGAPANRLSFARWLVSRDNPLTARVTVNRQWQAFFGRGIVRTLGDFGTQGDKPTHPELLDWLATEFMDHNWSFKQFDRLIVTSSTYRQTSAVSPELLEKDPDNLLYARAPRFRLDAEIIRDSALNVAGLLSEKIGGPSVFPPQVPSVTTEGTYGPLTWTPSTGPDRYRRSLYTFSKRTAPFALYTNFDAPTGDQCVTRRDLSNTPLQSLSLLNNTNFIEAYQALGTLIANSPGDDTTKAADLFRRCLSREPQPEELSTLLDFCRRERHRFESKELDPIKVAAPGPGDPIARATWTTAARAVLNLDEAITRN